MLQRLSWLTRRAGPAIQNPFRGTHFDREEFARAIALPPADYRYVIFFTPRSGSSRVTDLVRSAGGMGVPDECFNPAFLPDIANAYSARTMDEYIELLVRKRQIDGIFGCEVTWPHIFTGFLTGKRFLKAIQPTSTLWLIREDIVAQAVSISRMMQTGVSHVPASVPDELSRSEKAFTYDPKGIRHVLMSLRRMEARTEKLLKREKLNPLRLSYEDTLRLGPQKLMTAIIQHVGARKIDLSGLHSAHKKIPGRKNKEFSDRFRAENPKLIARVELARAPMLEAHAASRLY